MSVELARRLGREGALKKRAELAGLRPRPASPVPVPAQPAAAPPLARLNVKPQRPGNFGGLWSAFQGRMQDPAHVGALLGNPAAAPLTKGLLGATGAAGLFGMTDLLRSGGSNVKSLLAGPIGSSRPA